MTCKNCGSESSDGPFCEVCGARLDSADVISDTDNSGNTEIPKKRSKKPLIIGAATAAVLIIGGVCIAFASSISGFFRKTFSSPEDYYRYVEMSALKNNAEAFSDAYDTYLDNMEKMNNRFHMDMALKLEDGGRSLLGTVMPTDITWLKEVSLKINSRSEDSSSSSDTALYLNDSKLLTFQRATDLDLLKIYMKIPDLSDSYLLMDFAEILKDVDGDLYSGLNLSGMALQLSDYCPDGETAAKMLNRYGELIYGNISEVTKEKATLEVDGISQKCTVLEATIRSDELCEIEQKVINELRNDKDIEKIIRAFADDAQKLDPYGDIPDADTFYQEFISSLDEAIDEFNDTEDDADDYSILSTIWIGKGSQIVGRDFSLVSDGETEQILYYARPQQKNDFSLEADLNGDDTRITITGNGQISANKENSTYTFSIDDAPMFTVEAEDYDLKASKDGSSSGSLLFRPCSGLANLMEMDAYSGISSDSDADIIPIDASPETGDLSLFSNYSLKISFNNTSDSNKMDITVLSADVPMFTISLNTEYSDVATSNLPEDSDTVYDMMDEEAFMDYMMSINWDGFLDALKNSDIPSEYTELIEDTIEGFQESLEFYSQYY